MKQKRKNQKKIKSIRKIINNFFVHNYPCGYSPNDYYCNKLADKLKREGYIHKDKIKPFIIGTTIQKNS